MATAKKRPAAKAAAKSNGKAPAKAKSTSAASNKKWANVELPDGYTAISGGEFGDRWDFEANPSIEGTVDGIREVESGTGKNKRTSRVMTVQTGDGPIDVWESASLRKFFDECEDGSEVAIIFKGYRDVGRPQPMKDFVGAIAQKASRSSGRSSRSSRR